MSLHPAATRRTPVARGKAESARGKILPEGWGVNGDLHVWSGAFAVVVTDGASLSHDDKREPARCGASAFTALNLFLEEKPLKCH